MNSLKHPSSILCLGTLLVLIVLLTVREIVQVDPLFHIAAGRQVLSEGLPFTNVFLQFHSDFAISNHEWLYQIGVTLIYGLGGFPALSIFKLLFIVIFFSCAAVTLKTRSRPAAAFVLTLLLLASFPRLIIRPELYSILALATVIELLERYRLRRKKLTLIALITVQLLWVNIHGLWILGWGACLVYLGEQLATQFLQGKLSFCAKQKPSIKAFATVQIIFTTLAFASPYTWQSAVYPFQKILGSGAEQQRILELQSPLLYLSQGSVDSLALIALGLLATLGLILSLKRAQFRISHALLFFGVSYFALKTTRTLPFAAVVSLPLAITALRQSSWQKIKLPMVATGLCLVLSAYTGYHAVKNHYHTSPLFKAKIGLSRHPVFDYPELAQLPKNQAYFNNFSAGHALLFARAEQPNLSKPYICASTDLYSKDFYDRYWAAANGLGLAELLNEYRLNYVFVDHRTAPQLFVAMANLGGWDFKALNHSCAVFQRQSPATIQIDIFATMLRAAKSESWSKQFSSEKDQQHYQMLHLATALELTGRDAALEVALFVVGQLKDQKVDWVAIEELEARLLLAQGFKAESDQLYDRLAKDNPGNAQIQLSAANSALTSNRLDIAKQRFLQARKVGALAQAVDRGLAQTLLSSQDLIALRRHVHDSSLEPEWKAFFKGRAAAVEKSYKRAQKFYFEALEARPDLHVARYYLAELLYHMRQYKLSAKQFAKLLARQPRDADAWEYYGAALFKLEKFDAATDAWANATQLSPRRPNLWFNLARAHLQTKKLKEAELANQQCLKLVKVFRSRTTLTGSLKASFDKLEKNALVLKAQIDRHQQDASSKATEPSGN